MTGIDEETFSETDPDIISDDSTTQEKLPFTPGVEPASDETTSREDIPSPPQIEEKRYKKTTFQADSDNSSDESTTHVKRPFTSDFDDSSDDADKRVLTPVSDPNDKPDDTNAQGNLPSMPDSTTTFGIETLVIEDESEFINVFHSSEEEEPSGASPAEVVDSKPTLDYKPKPGDHLKESLPAILEEYPMTRKPRGFAVIFNIEEFHKIPGDPTSIDLDNRLGSSKDVEALRKAFENLHFIVDRHDNTTIGNIICITDGYASRDHSELDCFVVCILTHGSEGKLYDTNGRPFQFETIFKKFYADKCRSLSGKPKMFFIQACQGSQDHDGRNLPVDAVLHRRTSNIIFREGKTNFFEGNSPADADFLVFFPARLGLPAFRNDNQGSWFIQSLAENLEKYGERCPLNDILNIVKREVSTRFVEDQDGKRYTQTPKDDSTLLKTVFFRPLGPP